MDFARPALIYNPVAGGIVRWPRAFARCLDLLRSRWPSLSVHPTSGPGEARALARQCREAGADLILVSGGDGTLNEVIQTLAGTPLPVALLPAGTANVLAREIGLSRRLDHAVAQLDRLEPRRIALGLARPAGAPPRYFLLMAGAGLDARVIDRVNPRLKERFGKLAYWVAGLALMGSRQPLIEAAAEGRCWRTLFALASRVRNCGGDLAIASRASLFEDRFELVTFPGASTWPYALYLAGAVLGRATSLSGVSSVFTRRVEFRSLFSIAGLQVDGERAGDLPATVELVPDALSLLAPPPRPRPHVAFANRRP